MQKVTEKCCAEFLGNIRLSPF